MVFIPEQRRGTLCVSSQAGCALDCAFCATGKQGYSRDLSTAEIVGQLWLAKFLLAEQYQTDEQNCQQYRHDGHGRAFAELRQCCGGDADHAG